MEGIGEEEEPEKEQPQCWTSRVGPIAKGSGSQQGRNHHSLRCPRRSGQVRPKKV